MHIFLGNRESSSKIREGTKKRENRLQETVGPNQNFRQESHRTTPEQRALGWGRSEALGARARKNGLLSTACPDPGAMSRTECVRHGQRGTQELHRRPKHLIQSSRGFRQDSAVRMTQTLSHTEVWGHTEV